MQWSAPPAPSGTVMRQKLRERRFPASEIVPFASERSAGRELDGAIVQPLTDETIQGFDLAIFSAGGATSGEWAPRFVDAGAVVVDNSSKWRRDPEVPLVVAEVNPDALEDHKGLIANPNCSTMQLMVALKPIHDAAGHRAADRLHLPVRVRHGRQGRRGAGAPRPTRCCPASRRPTRRSIRTRSRSTCIGGAGNFVDDHTDEERKMMFETRKILGDESIAINVTCARVPVRNCHSESVTLQTREPLEVEEARGAPARDARPHDGRALPDCAAAPRAVTTSSSAACGATRRTSAGFACGWSPTTCSRARRPTRSRSPRSCTSGTSSGFRLGSDQPFEDPARARTRRRAPRRRGRPALRRPPCRRATASG